MSAEALCKRLDKFMETWLANPAAQLEFVRLVLAAHEQESHDHADEALYEWIDEKREGLRSIGIR